MSKIDLDTWLRTLHPNEALTLLAEKVNHLEEVNELTNIEILKLSADVKFIQKQVKV
jgi:hypothetical protein